MTTTPEQVEQLRRNRERLRILLTGVGDLRPGSLAGRYRRCGKPNCRCAAAGANGHGPSWSLTRKDTGGKTITRIVPAGAVEQTRAQIAEYQRFRALVGKFVAVNDEICQAQLQTAEAVAPGAAAKKGGSKRTLKRKSARKSKR